MSRPTVTDPVASSPVYPAGARINEAGHLEVAGCDVVELAREFGTPAYLYDEDDLRARARSYMEAFRSRTERFEVIYGSKAFPCAAAYRLFREEGLSIDVTTGGELHLALRAGCDPARIHLHGNNKSRADLAYAIESGVGHVIVDSFEEVELLDSILDRPQRVLVRVTPGVRAGTHSKVQTGQVDSKFGFGLADGLAARAVEAVRGSRHLELVGLHAHIGSQLMELDPYVQAIEALGELADFEPELVNVGGGLGVAYTSSDRPPDIERYVQVKVEGVARVFGEGPRVCVEPGRSLVANAGLTVYRVGTVKEIPGVRTYVAVDGGMSDNLRPMLYDARYEAIVANRAGEEAETLVTVAGMHCESGDILIRDVQLAAPAAGDLLVTPATGAYGHALANNYNAVTRPPVVFCSGGDARLVVRRETREDLTRRDIE